MGKAVVVIGWLLVASLPAGAADQRQTGVPYENVEKQDQESEDACDCCQKCKAARRPVVPEAEQRKEEKLKEEGNGCKDCCERCGEVLPPAPEETPPEVIEKEIPPEFKDNPKR